jgi:hypothetical protein
MYDYRILYRSVGISLENFNPISNEQISLFSDTERREKNAKLAESLDRLEHKFGRNIVKTGFTTDVEYKQDFISK